MIRLRKKQEEKSREPQPTEPETRLTRIEASLREIESEIEEIQESMKNYNLIAEQWRKLQNERLDELERIVKELRGQVNVLDFNFKEMKGKVEQNSKMLDDLVPYISETLNTIKQFKREYRSYRKRILRTLEELKKW